MRKNGCKDHPDCFTCPYEDCIAEEENPREKKYTVFVNTYMTREMAHTVGQIAKGIGCSRSEVVRRLIEKGLQYVNKELLGGGQA